jgi:hypothetical protein
MTTALQRLTMCVNYWYGVVAAAALAAVITAAAAAARRGSVYCSATTDLWHMAR